MLPWTVQWMTASSIAGRACRRRRRRRRGAGLREVYLQVVQGRCLTTDTSTTSTSRPSRMMPTRSHRRSTSGRLWEETKAVRPSSRLASLMSVELLLHQRVEARGGFVQDEQFRPVHQRLDEPDLLLVAAGE